MTTVLKTSPRQFVSTPAVERVALRAFRYLQSGYSVHLRGAAGTGKTTLALHLADLMARPIMLIFGDDEFKTSDLIGNQTGYTRKKVVDNYIHSVVKVEDEMRQHWVDSRLTLACREGFTLVYDEFNRSRPEVNNVLLSALEEKLLALPPNNNRSEYVRVSPHFRAVFTSNPEEYCGVHATQDALLDRLVTINMPEPDELTQQEIAVHKTQIDRESALMIIRLVKAFRMRTGNEKASGLRSALMLSKICVEHEILVMPENTEFREVCQDILLSRSGLPTEEATRILWNIFNEMIQADTMQSHSVNSYNLGNAAPEAIASVGLSNREMSLPNRDAHPESSVAPASPIDCAPQSRVISRGADEAAEFELTAIAASLDDISEDFELPTETLELVSVANSSVENFPQQTSGSAFTISHKALKK